MRYYVYILGIKTHPNYDVITHVKIGRTKDLKSRVRSLQTSNPFKIIKLAVFNLNTTPDGITTEKYLHEKFKKFRITGEWFTYAPVIHKWLLNIIAATPPNHMPRDKFGIYDLPTMEDKLPMSILEFNENI